MAIIDIAQGAISYLRSNPLFLVQAARNAARLDLSLPLDVLRWAIEQRPRGKGPERIEIFAVPPGLGVGLTVDLYGTKIDVGAHLFIEAVENLEDVLKITLRVRNLEVKAPPGSPAAMMLQALDFSRPGNLMNLMPQKHNALVEAKDDLFVIDLLRIRKLAENQALRRVLAALADTVRVRRVVTEGDLLLVGFTCDPLALPAAVARLRAVG